MVLFVMLFKVDLICMSESLSTIMFCLPAGTAQSAACPEGLMLLMNHSTCISSSLGCKSNLILKQMYLSNVLSKQAKWFQSQCNSAHLIISDVFIICVAIPFDKVLGILVSFGTLQFTLSGERRRNVLVVERETSFVISAFLSTLMDVSNLVLSARV